jgi:DNA-binding transcriptional regulator YiaG
MTFKELRELSGMNMKQFANYFNIPYRTVQDWEYGNRQCNDYIIELMKYKLENENIIK